MVACLIVERSWKEGAGSESIYVQGQGSQERGQMCDKMGEEGRGAVVT